MFKSLHPRLKNGCYNYSFFQKSKRFVTVFGIFSAFEIIYCWRYFLLFNVEGPQERPYVSRRRLDVNVQKRGFSLLRYIFLTFSHILGHVYGLLQSFLPSAEMTSWILIPYSPLWLSDNHLCSQERSALLVTLGCQTFIYLLLKIWIHQNISRKSGNSNMALYSFSSAGFKLWAVSFSCSFLISPQRVKTGMVFFQA